ncbi:MAG TPA: DNA polymerase IV [Vicinamibacterales bacterium]
MPKPPLRRIVHVDMDAFYASIEQRDDPSLRGKPVAVGRDPSERGVVAAANYEARRFGVHSAMSSAVALRLCPDLVLVHPDFSKYCEVSSVVFGIFRSATPLVEPLSLDEAYLDVTENAWQEPLGMNVARRIKDAIRATTGLTASAGVAPNKFLAKIASGWKKPDGLTVIAPERVESFLRDLPVDALWGVGPVTARRLGAIGITRTVQLRTIDAGLLEQAVGSAADWLVQLARGIDDRIVEPDRPVKSSGTESTYPQDLVEIGRIREEVERMAGEAAAWLERHELYARTVTIKVRYSDFTTITRSHSSLAATRDRDDLVRRAIDLLGRTEAGRRPARLLGVTVHNLVDVPGESRPRRHLKPMPLFDDDGRAD